MPTLLKQQDMLCLVYLTEDDYGVLSCAKGQNIPEFVDAAMRAVDSAEALAHNAPRALNTSLAWAFISLPKHEDPRIFSLRTVEQVKLNSPSQPSAST